jgi:undecaprenyl-diphosphatase
MEWINFLKDIDQQLFLFLNSLHHPFISPAMSWISGRAFWIPFYLFLLFLIIKSKGIKALIFILPAVFLLILASDQVSVHLFKEVFKRYRPCHNENIKDLVYLVDGCGGIYGFISSHAANTFALAVFIGKLLKGQIRYMLAWMLVWAAVVSYSRIYLGVHYPADILAGGAAGAVIGFSVFQLYLYSVKWLEKPVLAK